MRSAALAFAWEFRQRHRWGLLAIALYVLALAGFRLVLLEPGRSPLESEQFAFTVIVPLTSSFFYLLAVFSFGLTGDVAARQSMYPARLFTLPVTSAALAGWPMLYGTASIASLWLVSAGLGLRPAGVDVPFIWPALFLAAFLAWTQVLTWLPYGLPGLRVVIATLLLISADTIVLLALHLDAPEPLMVAVLAPLLPLACVAACRAVAIARRGHVPDWRLGSGWLARSAAVRHRRRADFRSTAQAQCWFEWRQHGGALPLLVAMVVPFQLGLLFVPGMDTPGVVVDILLIVLLAPPLLATFVAPRVRRADAQPVDGHGLSPFLATLPVTGASLIAAKLKVTVWSTLGAWLLVLLATPLALERSRTLHIVIDGVRQTSENFGAARVTAILLLGLAVLIAATWKQLVQSLYIGLTGRDWLVKGSVFATLALLVIIWPILHYISGNDAAQVALWGSLRWFPAVLVAVKILAAAWVATRLQRSGLLSERTLLIGAATWLAAVLALYGLLGWIVGTLIFPHYLLVLLAILLVPLARIAAAPLALDWNRHRGRAPTRKATARRRILAAVLLLIALPVTLAAVEALSFYAVNWSNGSIVSSGERREYVLYVPKGYDPSRPTPLVISMHGAGLWGGAQMQISRWNEAADEYGFIVVYPSGVRAASPRIWHVDYSAGLMKDVRFIAELIDTLRTAYNIDRTRIYANGMSNGGGMSFVLSCTLSDRIAAVGLVAPALTLPWRWCTDQRPVPVIAVHGTADRAAPYHGGASWVSARGFADVPGFLASWARRNRCASDPIAAAVAGDVTRRTYGSCAADVVLYTIEGGGHVWPGGRPLPEWMVGPNSSSIDATRALWSFFRAHPLGHHEAPHDERGQQHETRGERHRAPAR